jgi:hypothetical protein
VARPSQAFADAAKGVVQEVTSFTVAFILRFILPEPTNFDGEKFCETVRTVGVADRHETHYERTREIPTFQPKERRGNLTGTDTHDVGRTSSEDRFWTFE